REYAGATVSTPVEWPELERALYPEDFHIRNMAERLRRVGDPLAAFFAHPQSLAPLLESGRDRRAPPMADAAPPHIAHRERGGGKGSAATRAHRPRRRAPRAGGGAPRAGGRPPRA